MDALYILGNGSLSNNDEIKFSVRSLCKHMLDLEDIYIVGEDPGFLPKAKKIPFPDEEDQKWKNAFKKVRRGAEIPELSEEFLLMNDDFFMNEDFLGSEWPFYAIKNSNGGPCGVHSFHVHCPIRLNKEFFLKMPFDIEQKACKSPRTFYANFYKAPPKFCDDFILVPNWKKKIFDEEIKGLPCFSIGDQTMKEKYFRIWIKMKFPEKSNFEKS